MAAAVIGPGLGLDAEARRIVDAVVFGWHGPKVVDADAISHFAGRAAELTRAKHVVLTPHAGELGRLLGIPYAEVDDDRFGAVARAVELTGAVVLLKGRYTIVGTPGDLPIVNPSGGPALATGGSGDVLSGIIAALCCELAPRDAASVGAYVHGAAADSWSAAHGGADRGLLAHEIGDALPAALAACFAP
jgi:NAD(P)H-hydrate epimerase